MKRHPAAVRCCSLALVFLRSAPAPAVRRRRAHRRPSRGDARQPRLRPRRPPARASSTCSSGASTSTPRSSPSFEKENDCKVTIDLYEDNESMMAKLQGGGTSLYDVVVPGQYMIPVMAKLNLLAELRPRQHPEHHEPRRQVLEPGLRPGQQVLGRLPVGHGRHLHAEEAGQDQSTQTWGLLFDKQAVRALPADGLDPRDDGLGPEGTRARASTPRTPTSCRPRRDAAARDAKQRSQGFEGGVGGKNKVLGKAVTPPWSTTATPCAAWPTTPRPSYFVPEEGGVLWVDNLAIPAKAPHLDAGREVHQLHPRRRRSARSSRTSTSTPRRTRRRRRSSIRKISRTSAIYPSAEDDGASSSSSATWATPTSSTTRSGRR